MRKAKGILIFGLLFIAMSFVYGFINIELYEIEPTNEMILERENQMAFIKTTFWSGILMIGIALFLRLKAKFNTK